MAFKLVWVPQKQEAIGELARSLKSKRYYHRVESPGVCIVPSGHSYGDAEDIADDLRAVLPSGVLSVIHVMDEPEQTYHY